MFWEYVTRKLRFLPLREPGPLAALVRGAAGSLDRAREDIAWMRRAMLPGTAPADLLERIAAGRGLCQWPGETEEAYRIRCTIAWLYWKKGGNPLGLAEILESFGYERVQLTEHTGEGWAEFSLAMGLDEAVPHTEYLVRLVHEVKPARSRLRGLDLTSELAVSAVARAAVLCGRVRSQVATGTMAGSLSLRALCIGRAGCFTAVMPCSRKDIVAAPVTAAAALRCRPLARVTPGAGRASAGIAAAGVIKTTMCSNIRG